VFVAVTQSTKASGAHRLARFVLLHYLMQL